MLYRKWCEASPLCFSLFFVSGFFPFLFFVSGCGPFFKESMSVVQTLIGRDDFLRFFSGKVFNFEASLLISFQNQLFSFV